MSRSPKTPADLVRRLAAQRAKERQEESVREDGVWRRETFRLPRDQARELAREFFERYPKAAYMTEVESWRVLDDGSIEFTMRRLPSAD